MTEIIAHYTSVTSNKLQKKSFMWDNIKAIVPNSEEVANIVGISKSDIKLILVKK